MAGVQEITRDKNLLCETTETCMGELTKATKDFAIDVSMICLFDPDILFVIDSSYTDLLCTTV